jgi:O-antigen/teichoic acid export membrane protein
VDLGATYHTLVAYLWFNGVFFFVLNALRAELQSAKYSFLMTLMTVVSACVTLYLMNEYGLGIDGLLAGMTIANTIPVFVGLWWLRSNLLAGFDISFLKKMLVFSFPLMLAGIAFWGSIYIDRIMINDLLSLADVGVYGVGYRLSSVISIVVAGVRSAFLPLVYSNLRDRETPAKIAIILRTYLFVVLFLYLVASLFATDLIVLFTSQSFYQASNTLVFLMPAIILANMDIFAPGIGISQKSSILIWTNLGSATLNLALNYVLIPVLGITGAAVATMTSSLLLTIVMISISQRLYYIPYAWLPIVLCSTIALSIAVLVPLLHIGTYMRVTVNICSLIAFLFLSMKLQLLKPTDAVDLKSVIQPSAETN